MEYKTWVSKRKYKGMWPNQWPWVRSRTTASINADKRKRSSPNYDFREHNFASRCVENEYPDMYSKMAAIKASPFVVSLVTYLDDKEICQGTGTIIEEDGIILTSAKLFTHPSNKNVLANNLKVIVYLSDEKSYEAQLLAHDFYYDIAVVKIPAQIKPPMLRLVNDCVSLDSSGLPIHDEERFQLRPHSEAYNLVPGDKVIALGRNFIKPYEIMAAPGEFSIQRCSAYIECKEVFKATCLITEIGKGGPLLNCRGEFIGVASFDYKSTPFLPINVALKWWGHCKTYGKLSRPVIGMELANLYNVGLHVRLLKSSGTTSQVKQGSPADTAGICPNDIIVQCCGKPVRSFMELFDIIWDNMGNSVELGVVRARNDARLVFVMDVVDAIENNKRKREHTRSY